jgi:predicted nucleic acid-binding protein
MIMRVFIDTNIILDFFMRREGFDYAEALLKYLKQHKAEMMMSVGGFYTIHFVILRYLHKEKGLRGEECLMNLRGVLRQILLLLSVAEHDSDSLMKGIMDEHFKDLEDSCQYQLALKSGCTALITFNTSDYANATGMLSVVTPEEFLSSQR